MRGLYWMLAGAILFAAAGSVIAGEEPYGATPPAATPAAPEPAATETPAMTHPSAHEPAAMETVMEVVPVRSWVFVLRNGKLIKYDLDMKVLKIVDLKAEFDPATHRVKIGATDEGVFILAGNRLWRFDHELNLQKKAEIPEKTEVPETTKTP